MTEQPISSFETEKNHVGEGWQKLIEFTHHYVSLLDPGYEVLQIKEKFGGLRYYVRLSADLDPSDSAIAQGIIDMAEQISFLICEECGGHGRVKSMQGWLKTLCEKDAEKLLAEREQRRQELREQAARRQAEREAEKAQADG